jgi:WD repeat-containing protein 24
MPNVTLWRPHQVLTDCLMLQTEIGDVQTSASILICLGDNRKELMIDETVHVSL